MFRNQLGMHALLGVVLGVVLVTTMSCQGVKGKKGQLEGHYQLSKEAWNRSNAPERMGYDHLSRKFNYRLRFDQLPLSGKLDKLPWSGDYWPTYKGGITYRWSVKSDNEKRLYGYDILGREFLQQKLTEKDLMSLSPAEKYDLYIGDYSFPLTRYERKRTRIMDTVEGSETYDDDFIIPLWEGLCHAWAPATLSYYEPRPVTMINRDGLEIPFGSSDIKALLTYFLHMDKAAKTSFLGDRCNVKFTELEEKFAGGEITRAQMNREMNSNACRDTNAGAFHLVLTNQIGLLNEGFIADVTRDFEVWNQAVSSYQTRVLNVREGRSSSAAPGTVREVLVETVMTYVQEVEHSWTGGISSDGFQQAKYRYVLELNRKGEIIGGEWISKDRPDFLWKQTTPEFNGFFRPLKKIYLESIKN